MSHHDVLGGVICFALDTWFVTVASYVSQINGLRNGNSGNLIKHPETEGKVLYVVVAKVVETQLSSDHLIMIPNLCEYFSRMVLVCSFGGLCSMLSRLFNSVNWVKHLFSQVVSTTFLSLTSHLTLHYKTSRRVGRHLISLLSRSQSWIKEAGTLSFFVN